MLENIESYFKCSTNKRETMSKPARNTIISYGKRFEKSGLPVNKNGFIKFVQGLNIAQSSKVAIAKILGRYLYFSNYLTKEEFDIVKQSFKSNTNNWSSKGLTEDEVIEIIKNISGGHFYRLRNAAGILILATLGLRINQLLDIKLKDVKTVEHGYDITFKELKKKYSQNNRTLPIVNELYIGGFSVTRILTDYLKERNSIEVKSPYLFVNKFGKKLSDGLFRIMLNDVSNEALGYSITPHYLRHYVVSNCAKNHGITSAALLAGHSNVTTTQKYVSEKNFDFKEIIGINHG